MTDLHHPNDVVVTNYVVRIEDKHYQSYVTDLESGATDRSIIHAYKFLTKQNAEHWIESSDLTQTFKKVRARKATLHHKLG